MNRYDDIKYYNYAGSETHAHMSMRDRAAQFSPFAALTGFEEIIDESARLTDEMNEITQDKRSQIDSVIKTVSENLRRKPRMRIEYFIPDPRKAGGKYVTVIKNIVKIDEIEGRLIASDGSSVDIDSIWDIDFEG